MNKQLRFATTIVAAATIGATVLHPVSAAPLIANGGFESGFLDWTTADQPGSDGNFYIQSGTSSPLSSFDVPAPPEGINAAMTDSGGPGAHVLYQDFTVPDSGATISFELFIGNRADAFETFSTLDFSTPAHNQQARVDIIAATIDPFTVAAADVLMNLYQTNPGDPLVSGYTTHTVDLTTLFAGHAGETWRLRFAETDNLLFFQFGVDNVVIAEQSVPEPGSMLLLGAALAALVASRRATGSWLARL